MIFELEKGENLFIMEATETSEKGTQITINKNGVLEMTPPGEPVKADNLNSYLTWGNVWKAITVICIVGWFFTTQLRDDSVNNTVRDLRAEQISKDVTNILESIKEMRTEAKTNDTQIKERLSTVESDTRLLRNEVNELKNK